MTGSVGPDEGGPPAIRPSAGQPVAPAEANDHELLRAHVEGDRDAFTVLFHRHRHRLWAVALRTLGDQEEAADALQDALLSAHRSAARFRGDSAVTTWLHRIVLNACLDRIRRRQAHPTVPLPDGPNAGDDRWSGAEPAAPAPDRDTVLVVRQALAALPVEQRTALVLVDMQGYPVAEVATILGVAEGTVKSRCARGRARLATLLADLRPARSGAPVRAAVRAPGPGSGTRPPADLGGGPRIQSATSGNQPSDSGVRSETIRSARVPGHLVRDAVAPRSEPRDGYQEEQ